MNPYQNMGFNPMVQANPMVQNPYANMNFNKPFQQQAPQNNGIIWVQGIEGAKAYQLTPNSNAILLDSENEGVFYIKISDNVGMCTLRIFSFVETTGTSQSAAPQTDMSMYVTRDELNKILDEMRASNEQSVSTVSRKSGAK